MKTIAVVLLAVSIAVAVLMLSSHTLPGVTPDALWSPTSGLAEVSTDQLDGTSRPKPARPPPVALVS